VPVSLSLADLDRLLAHAERATALLDRCRPLNASTEMARLVEGWEAGRAVSPEWRYATLPELGPVRRILESVARGAGGGGAFEDAYSARARELALEAAIVAALGTPGFREHAARRFSVDGSDGGKRAEEEARRWAALEVPSEEPLVASDDERDPRSLLSTVQKLVGELRLPVRVTTSPTLPCAAAAGDGLVVVRAGISHAPSSARRIALHEIHGHVLPRQRAKSEPIGLFRTGTERGSDDEEGRALLIEERHGLFDARRKRELGLRHLAALAVRNGADWVETVRVPLSFGASPRDAVMIACRVYRGGGLAREIVYLPARQRVAAAFLEDPSLENWLERGRIGVDAARRLSAAGRPPREARLFAALPELGADPDHENVATTGV
jgi:hypothetical protein